MPERSNGAVSKTVVLSDRDRGFESPFLRKFTSHRWTNPVNELIYRIFCFSSLDTRYLKWTNAGVPFGGDEN